MKRTTVFLEEQLLKRLQRAARRQGTSAATLVREALEQYLAGAPGTTSVPRLAGRFASGQRDTSERVDSLLWTDPHA